MNQLRISRCLLRQLEPLAIQRYIHTTRIASSRPQSRVLAAIRSSSLPPRSIQTRRWQSTLTSPTEARTPEEVTATEDRWANTPAYEMSFTCKPCSTRSTHKISKQGYHHGTVLITCPSCRNRHLIADHMKVCSFPANTQRCRDVARGV
jgi:protein import protein ZIM17